MMDNLPPTHELIEKLNLAPVYSALIPVRWGDMDSYGHVNNATYLRYMEEARVQMLAVIGYTLDGKGAGPVVVNTTCTYLLPVDYPNTVRVDSYIAQPGHSSFMTYYRLYSESNGHQLVCEGSAKVVWIDFQSGNSVEFPSEIREIINTQSMPEL